MNILTGIAFCVFVLFYVAAQGSSARKKAADTYATIAAVSLICLTLFAGHWIAVLLGKL